MTAATKIIFFDDAGEKFFGEGPCRLLTAVEAVSYTHLRAHET